MDAPILRQCLCSCGRQFARPKSLPLCKQANARAWAICRALPLEDEFNAESRRNYRFWSSAEVVQAALLGEVAHSTPASQSLRVN